MDDGNGSYPRTEAKLSTASNTFNPDSSKKGWYLQFTNSEKSLARPAIFDQLVYFTTFTPSGGAACSGSSGSAKLYIVGYLSGGEATLADESTDLKGTTSSRSIDIGLQAGIPSAPVISIDKRTGHATVTVETTSTQALSKTAFSPTTNKNLLYWRKVSQ
jgi:Tfp pilus tip-associated adhesin PilY1